MSVEKSHYTVKEIAVDLDVSTETVRTWVRNGELKAIDIGKGYRIPKEEYRRFLKARSTTRETEKQES